MARWNSVQWTNFVKAKLENFGKEWWEPFFRIVKWNGKTEEEIWRWDFIEWDLKSIEIKEPSDPKFSKIVEITLLDEDLNEIKWNQFMGKATKKILYKLYQPKTIGKVRFKCWMYNDNKYISTFIDWQKRDDPYSTRDEWTKKYTLSEEISSRLREIKDPETWVVVKVDDSKLVDWICNEIVPTINRRVQEIDWDALVGNTNDIDINNMECTAPEKEDIDLPF